MSLQYLISPWLLAVIGALGLAFVVLGLLSGRERTIAWLRRAGMLLMALSMGLAPAVIIHTTSATSNLAIYFVVDATGSMAAEDYDGGRPRMDGVRADALALVGELPSAHYSIIEYSSTTAQQLPLTTDKQAVRTWLEVYDREYTDYSAGSSINRPVEDVAQLVGRQHRETFVPIVVFMTDGESTKTSQSNRNEKPEFGAWKDLFKGGMVLGYGTEQGGPMKYNSAWQATDEYIQDPAGGDAISRADLEALQTAADQIGVPFYHRTSPEGMADIAAALDVDSMMEDSVDEVTYSPVIWPFAVIFALLTAWEIAYLVPHLRTAAMLSTKRQTLDTRSNAQRPAFPTSGASQTYRAVDGSPRVPVSGSDTDRWAGRQ